MELFQWRQKNLDPIFLDRRCGITGRRPIRTKRLIWGGAILLVAFIGLELYFGPRADDQERSSAFKSGKDSKGSLSPEKTGETPSKDSSSDSNQKPGVGLRGLFPSLVTSLGSASRSAGNSSAGSRSFAANQVIRRGENGNDPLTRLPLGTTISARLINSIISTNTASPVIAEIPQEIFVHDTSSIPEGAKAIGQATFDDSTRRIQIRFNTLVYPDGDSHSVQGMAMMPDGSAGLEGDYHSETGKRELGNFLGNFVAGFTAGMEDRATGGGLGLPYEVGSLRNGVLNGASQSSQSEAKAFSDDLAKSKPYMTLSGGKSFVIYLDHEFLP